MTRKKVKIVQRILQLELLPLLTLLNKYEFNLQLLQQEEGGGGEMTDTEKEREVCKCFL